MDTDTSNEVRAAISHAVGELCALMSSGVRVWRYVESQKALFGFLASDVTDLKFDDYVAFLRDDGLPVEASVGSPLAESLIPGVVHVDGALWEIRPAEGLPEAAGQATVLVLLKKPGDLVTRDNLLGVVCLDGQCSGIDNELRAQVAGWLAKIRDQLHTYSLLQFSVNFLRARAFIRRGGEPTPKELDVKTVETQLQSLVQNLQVRPADVAIYVRPIVEGDIIQEQRIRRLIAGVGEFYDLLYDAETRLRDPKRNISRERQINYDKAMFSQHAYRLLKEQTGENEGIFFPGGGGAKDFDDHRQWLSDAQSCLLEVLGDIADTDFKDQIEKWSTAMIARGSFGVFPVRWSSGKGIQGPLVGLVCVASRNVRHFFTWTNRLLIEQFCQWLGRQHSDLAPFLDSVNSVTYASLMSSLEILRRVAPRSILLEEPAKEEQQCFAFVLSVDIRKSTDLMAKMVPGYADKYGDVLIGLWHKMKKVVLEEYGIFDKFTGDGILAYFPDFFEASRRTAALRLLRAVERCHDAFLSSYPGLWRALNAVPAMGSPHVRVEGRVGLGVGLDFGSVRLVNVGTELTIVGAPVVYACRLASAAWGFTTLANFPCYHAFRQSGILDLVDSKLLAIPIKHEEIQAYRVARRSWLDAPGWKLKDEKELRWDYGWLDGAT